MAIIQLCLQVKFLLIRIPVMRFRAMLPVFFVVVRIAHAYHKLYTETSCESIFVFCCEFALYSWFAT